MDRDKNPVTRDLAAHKSETPEPSRISDHSEGKSEKKLKKEKKQKKRSERGVEMMMRTSYRMHVEMSGLADSKANIMISINGIMISVILAAISPKLETSPWLLLPTTVLLVGCLVSLSYAILGARPRVTSDPNESAVNLMFFGSFTALSQEAFEKGVGELTGDPEELYRSMARDLYGLGKVLERKFALLRTAYTVFMGGLAAGVVLYIAVYLTIVLTTPSV